MDSWILSIADVTALASRVRQLVSDGSLSAARDELPEERAYPLPPAIRDRVGATE